MSKDIEDLNPQDIHDDYIIKNDVNLNPIKKTDIERIRLWRNSASTLGVFIDNRIITREDQIRWYDKYKSNINDKMFIINYKNNPVGTVALYNIDFSHSTAEFGRLLIGDLNSRCKGIAFIATKLLCEYGFNKLGLNKIILEVYKDNIKAMNLYKKIGFKIIKEKNLNNREIVLMELYNENKGEV